MSDAKIIYWGPKDEQNVRGYFFRRGQVTAVAAETAGQLCKPKPRVFFHADEAKECPAQLADEYLLAPVLAIRQAREHADHYRLIALRYTDEDDEQKKAGAQSEVDAAEARIEGYEAERDARWAGLKAEDKKRLDGVLKAQLARVSGAQKAQVQAEKARIAKARAKVAGMLGMLGAPESVEVDPSLSAV